MPKETRMLEKQLETGNRYMIERLPLFNQLNMGTKVAYGTYAATCSVGMPAHFGLEVLAPAQRKDSGAAMSVARR